MFVSRDDPLSSDIEDQTHSGLYLQLCFAIGHDHDDLECSKDLSSQDVELSPTDVIRFDQESVHPPSTQPSSCTVNGLYAKAEEIKGVWGLDTCSYRANFRKTISLRAVECSDRSSHSFLSDISFLNDSINCIPALSGEEDSIRSSRNTIAVSPHFARLSRKSSDKTKAKRRPLWCSSLAASDTERHKSTSSRRSRLRSIATSNVGRENWTCQSITGARAGSSVSCSGLERTSDVNMESNAATKEQMQANVSKKKKEPHCKAGWRGGSSVSCSGLERQSSLQTKCSPPLLVNECITVEISEPRLSAGWEVKSSLKCSGVVKLSQMLCPTATDALANASSKQQTEPYEMPQSNVAPKVAGEYPTTKCAAQRKKCNHAGRDSQSHIQGSNGLLARAKVLSSRSLTGKRRLELSEAGDNTPVMSRGNSARSIQSLSVSSLQSQTYQSSSDIDANGNSTKRGTNQNEALRVKKTDDLSTRRGRRSASSLICKLSESRSSRGWPSSTSCDGKDCRSSSSTRRYRLGLSNLTTDTGSRKQSSSQREESPSHRHGRRSVSPFEPKSSRKLDIVKGQRLLIASDDDFGLASPPVECISKVSRVQKRAEPVMQIYCATIEGDVSEENGRSRTAK